MRARAQVRVEPPYEIEVIGQENNVYRIALPTEPDGQRVELTVTIRQLIWLDNLKRRAKSLGIIPQRITARQWEIASRRAFNRWAEAQK
ncbi:MAG: hypothetical protein AB7K64_09550 [Variibacter sp.]